MEEFILSKEGTRIKNYCGIKNNKLTAVRHSHTVNAVVFWDFKCECGNIKKLRPCKVFKEKYPTKSCGCIRKGNNAVKKLLRSYKKNAFRRNLDWNLSLDNFLLLTSNNCFYCGIKPSKISKSKYEEYFYNGIDRKNNSLGYTLENSLSCCTLCNKAKRDLDYKVFTDWIKQIRNYNK